MPVACKIPEYIRPRGLIPSVVAHTRSHLYNVLSHRESRLCSRELHDMAMDASLLVIKVANYAQVRQDSNSWNVSHNLEFTMVMEVLLVSPCSSLGSRSQSRPFSKENSSPFA